MKQRILVTATLIAVLAALAAFAGASQAQYPSPKGNVTGTVDDTTPSTNSQALLTCKVKDEAGNPVTNADCTFTIVSEPGTDAAVGSKTITKKTDANGVATDTLRTGSTPGPIVISITSGDLSSTVIVQVGGALPPAAPVVPPNTGDGGLACTSCR